MLARGIIENVDNFDRAQTLTTTPGYNGWTVADTSAAGTPTYTTVTENGGAMKLTLEATSEAQNVCMYQNDVLMLDLANLQLVEFIAKVSGIDSVTTLVFGVGTARNDTVASVTNCAWFKILGSGSTSNVLIDTRDGTTSNTGVATGTTLSSTYKKFTIDFQNGLADVRFFIDGDRVAGSTTFSMAAITADQNVQPIVQIQKASGTGVASVSIARIRTVQKFNYGA